MKNTDFGYRKIVDKIESKHNLTRDEVEQVLLGNQQFLFLGKGKIEGEDVYSVFGRVWAMLLLDPPY